MRHVQRRLNQLLGLRLPLDGKLGVMTRAAIRSLQRKNRLPADGIIRPQTARILSAASRRRIHTDEELDSEIDRNSYEYGLWVQRSLNRIMGSGLVEDGIIGTHTRSAIRDFQQRYGLLVDGIVGPQTEGALIKAGAAPPTGDETGAPAGSIPTTPKGKVLSGSYWVGQFRGSTSVDDLSSPFRENVRKFLAALTEAGAKYKISSTYRDPKRQYLMYWAKKIADGADPRSAASFPGVNIEWWHGSEEASRQAAQQMVDDFHIGGNPVGLVSRHTERKAIDMDISWSGSLRIRNVKGQYITITSAPRDGTNLDLGEVGRSYNVIHYDKDRPHWSIDGH
ncbi:MAG: peptidoglycan-binding protein [Blastocatellia bacterium]|nr:peptidoglycan-binding protein [Blastocatellia bacterium]